MSGGTFTTIGGLVPATLASPLSINANTYSTQIEIAANGGCWTCAVNPVPVDMY